MSLFLKIGTKYQFNFYFSLIFFINALKVYIQLLMASQEIQIILSSQSLAPISQKINLFCELLPHKIQNPKLITIYKNSLHLSSPLSQILLKPIPLPQIQQNREISEQAKVDFIQYFYVKGKSTIEQYINQQHLTSLQSNELAYKIIEIFLILAEFNLFIAINKKNLFISKGSEEDKNVKILATEIIEKTSKQQFVKQLAKILKIFALQISFSSYQQLSELYTKRIREYKLDEEMQAGLRQQLALNKKFFNQIMAVQEKSIILKDKIQCLSKSLEILTQQQIDWILKEENIKYKGHEISYRSKQDSFAGKKLWDHLTTLTKKQREHQLIVFQIIKQGIRSVIGFFSSCFTNPDNLSLMQKSKKFGCYLSDKGSKRHSLLINFTKKTLHPLKQQNTCVGYDPNKYLLCIGKCDIVLSNRNIINFCYFPVSFTVDIDEIVTNEETMCGNRQFQLSELYVYRFLK